MVLSSTITVMASETLTKEMPITEIADDFMLEDHEIEDHEIEVTNYLVCPSCDRGRLDITTKSYETHKYHLSDGWCGFTGYHRRFWNFTETTISCDTCSYHTVTEGAPRNEHCRAN